LAAVTITTIITMRTVTGGTTAGITDSKTKQPRNLRGCFVFGPAG